MEEERCQCPEDEISVNDLTVHGYNLSTSTHRVCGKVHYMFAGKQLGIGGFSRGVDSESPKPEETGLCINGRVHIKNVPGFMAVTASIATATEIQECGCGGRLIIWE